MANKTTEGKISEVLLSRGEALEMIALLSSQLANRTINGRMGGAVPRIAIIDRGVIVEQLVFCLDPEEKS